MRTTHCYRRNVRKIGCNPMNVDDIIKGQMVDQRAGLEEER